MTAPQLLRLSGIAALIGGALRLAGTFAPLWLPAAYQPGWYFATDVFFLLGFTGIYVSQSAAIGWVGLLGYLLGFVGVLVIRAWPGNYYVGAGMFLIGVTVLAVLTLLRGSLPKWAAALWIGAFLCGIAGLVLSGSGLPFILSGVLFSLGFIGAGLYLALRARIA